MLWMSHCCPIPYSLPVMKYFKHVNAHRPSCGWLCCYNEKCCGVWSSDGSSNERCSTQGRCSLTSSPCCSLQERCSQQAWKVTKRQGLAFVPCCKLQFLTALNQRGTILNLVVSSGWNLYALHKFLHVCVALQFCRKSNSNLILALSKIRKINSLQWCSYPTLRTTNCGIQLAFHILIVLFSFSESLLPYGLKIIQYRWT